MIILTRTRMGGSAAKALAVGLIAGCLAWAAFFLIVWLSVP